jgi:hypothetical protein
LLQNLQNQSKIKNIIVYFWVISEAYNKQDNKVNSALGIDIGNTHGNALDDK